MKPRDPPGKPPASPRPRCPGPPERPNVRCIAFLKAGCTHCASHDPARAGERAAKGLGRRQPGDIGSELGTLNGIARRAAKVLDELEHGIPIVYEERRKRGQPTHRDLDPKEASARINVLRFLAVMVRLRETPKKGQQASLPGTPGTPYDLEGALG